MVGFDTPIPGRIFCVLKDRTEHEISQQTYESIHSISGHSIVTITDIHGRIVFDGKRWEVERFRHVYNEEKKPDERMLNSYIYQQEKEKRDAYWSTLFPRLTQDEKDEAWSIIYARWGESYKKGCTMGISNAWKVYFREMWKIILLELAGYKDKISCTPSITSRWAEELEVPDIYGNLDLFRKTILHGQEVPMQVMSEGSEETTTQ